MSCHDCGIDYAYMEDLIIPNWAWVRISPTGDDGGLLCANCICGRLDNVGISNVPAAFMSGPLRTVAPELMQVLREVENIERALPAEES